MSEENDCPVIKKQARKTVYLDQGALKALEFLKTHHPGKGYKFSTAILMREMLAALKANPQETLGIERHAKRGTERGRPVCIPLAEDDLTDIEGLSDFYREHAKTRHRVRDGVPKSRQLPISQLFAAFLRDQARSFGWADEADRS